MTISSALWDRFYKIKSVIPKWKEDEEGITIREISEITNVPEGVVSEILNQRNLPGIERIACGNFPARYRQTKSF